MEPVGAIVFLPREGEQPPRLLENLLFSPAAAWLCAALETYGTDRFLVVCHDDDRALAEGCFPPGSEFVTVGAPDAGARLSAFLAARPGPVAVVTAPVLLAPAHCAVQASAPVPGLCQVESGALAEALTAGGDFAQTLEKMATPAFPGRCCPLAPDPVGRAGDEALCREFSVGRLLLGGVRILDPQSTFVDPMVTVGEGTLLLPGTILRGKTIVGKNCEIGPNSMIRDCVVGDNVIVNASQLNESFIDDGVKIGPFTHVRPNCHLGRNMKIGDFVELKNSTLGVGTKVPHLTYVGDSDVGDGVNFGCGTVTVNYDGAGKFRTTIGNHAFIGCNTNLVAPVRVGDGAYTAAGSTITDEVPADSLAIARSVQVVKKQWAVKRRKGSV